MPFNTIPPEERGESCHGSGWIPVGSPNDPDPDHETCDQCNGTGRKPNKPWIKIEPCPVCKGEGAMVDPDSNWRDVRCEECDGEKSITRDYLKEAFYILQGRALNYGECSAEHLKALTAYYREHVAGLLTGIPSSLASINGVLREIAQSPAIDPTFRLGMMLATPQRKQEIA